MKTYKDLPSAKAELLHFGLEVFENDKNKFDNWLYTPNITLNHKKPKDVLHTLDGIRQVKDILTRIEYGNLA